MYASPDRAGFSASALEHASSIVEQALDRVFPAAVVLIARHGLVVYHRAYGYFDPEQRQQPTPKDSLFDVASLTKLFTTTAFMRLVEAGYVGLDQPVAEILPEFGGRRPIGGTEDPLAKVPLPVEDTYAGREVDASAVTFRHLLTHTSGLAAWRSVYLQNPTEQAISVRDFSPGQVIPQERATRIAAIYKYDFAYPTAAKVVYSDLGLIILGEAIARLAGKPLELALREWVLEPLRLKDTGFTPPLSLASRIAPTEICAWRQRRLRGEVHDENAAGLGGVAGHAGLFTTAWDVAVLGQLYLNGGTYGDAALLTPVTVAEMTREQVAWEEMRRGLGWMLKARQGASCGSFFSDDSYGHTGFTGTSLWIDPRRDLLVVVMTNRVYYGRDVEGILRLRPAFHDAVIQAIEGDYHGAHGGTIDH